MNKKTSSFVNMLEFIIIIFCFFTCRLPIADFRQGFLTSSAIKRNDDREFRRIFVK
jgi:hypothetical protein